MFLQIFSGKQILEVEEEDETSTVEQVLAVATPIAAIAAMSPPPLNMFPPQGAPQPGAVPQGGGIIPREAMSVRINVNKSIKSQQHNSEIRKQSDNIK